MANNTKGRIYEELFKELADETTYVAEIDQIIKYMSDYFSMDELAGFLEHVKSEKGDNNTIEDDNEEDKE